MVCKNCHTETLEKQKYCFECGAKIIKNRLSLKNIFQDINYEFFNLDNLFVKTFLHLFSKPGYVINSFIEGTRKKHINVVQYFAISLTLAGFQIFLMTIFFKDAMNFNDMFDDLPNQENNPFKASNFDSNWLNSYQSLIYILSVPFSAVATWLAYIMGGNKRYNFTEHLVINLYYSAQIIIITAFLTIILLCFGVNYMMISSIVSLLTLIYWFYVLKCVFNTSFKNTLGTYVLMLLILAIFFVIIIVVITLFGVLITLAQKN